MLAAVVDSGSMPAVDELLSPTVTTFTATLGTEVGPCEKDAGLVAACSEGCEMEDVARSKDYYAFSINYNV